MLVNVHVIVKSLEYTYPIVTKYFFECERPLTILDFLVIE